MSRRETQMTIWYWEQIGGILIEEFLVVPRAEGQGHRLLDGLIILGEKKQRMPVGTRESIEGKDVVVVQTKNTRLGMYLMGQTLFSAQLIRRLGPRSVQSVALCASSDRILQPMLEANEGCKVIVCPPEVCRSTQTSASITGKPTV
ncbi:MAG: hypothetical protein AABY81_01110 [Pseudomonadota bacterium]